MITTFRQFATLATHMRKQFAVFRTPSARNFILTAICNYIRVFKIVIVYIYSQMILQDPAQANICAMSAIRIAVENIWYWQSDFHDFVTVIRKIKVVWWIWQQIIYFCFSFECDSWWWGGKKAESSENYSWEKRTPNIFMCCWDDFKDWMSSPSQVRYYSWLALGMQAM